MKFTLGLVFASAIFSLAAGRKLQDPRDHYDEQFHDPTPLPVAKTPFDPPNAGKTYYWNVHVDKKIKCDAYKVDVSELGSGTLDIGTTYKNDCHYPNLPKSVVKAEKGTLFWAQKPFNGVNIDYVGYANCFRDSASTGGLDLYCCSDSFTFTWVNKDTMSISDVTACTTS